MPDRYEYLAHLITGYLRQELTVDERTALEAWLAERPENQRFLDELDDTRHLQQKLQVFHAVDRERLWALTQSKLSEAGYGSATRPMRRIGKWVPYAAALLLGVVATAWFFFDKRPASDGLVVNQQVADIPPGGNRATLTLADGRTITLDEARDGIVIGGDEITYNDGNPLSEVEGNDDGQEEVPLLELTTPNGGTYQVTLPDGTKVWLNAASTLRYPRRFEGGKREVFLRGEGYFEVNRHPLSAQEQSDAVPFVVKAGNQETLVLGTGFNVSSYPEEQSVKTTLIHGAVQVSDRNRVGSRLVLEPGEQAIFSANGIAKEKIDVLTATGWKSGVFYFKNTPFVNMMFQIARWYDVEIVYESEVPTQTFSGEMERNVSLRTVLRLLSVSDIRYRVEGRKLIIE